MPSARIYISDEHDTEYLLDVEYDVLEAEPDVGLMSTGGEVTKAICEGVTMHMAGEKRIIYPRGDDVDDDQGLGEWLGKWCLETFEVQIHEKVNESACEYDPEDDRPEYINNDG